MNKKLISVIMAILMVLNLSVAFAAEIPSKTTQDMAQTVEVTTLDGKKVGADFVLRLTYPTIASTNELAAISNYVNMNNASLINYFGSETKSAAAELVPAGTDLDALKMYEFAPFICYYYGNDLGDLYVDFSFATAYTAGQTLIAIVGYVNGVNTDGSQIVKWTACKAEVTADNLVRVYISADLLDKVNASDNMIAILSSAI